MGTSVRSLQLVQNPAPNPTLSHGALPMSGSLAVAAALPDIPGVQRGTEVGERHQTGLTALPVLDGLERLLPWRGLRRGSVVAITAGLVGTTSLLFAVLREVSMRGGWCAIIGGPGEYSVTALVEAGLDPRRTPLVPDPGAKATEVAAALLDGIAIVAVHAPLGLSPQASRRLTTRARKSGAVLVPFGVHLDKTSGADAVLTVTGHRWHGLGVGRGRIRSRELDVESRLHGRRQIVTLAFDTDGISVTDLRSGKWPQVRRLLAPAEVDRTWRDHG